MANQEGLNDDKIIGKRFSKLVVIGIIETRHGGKRAECKCDCGGTICLMPSRLKLGHNKSCGCMSASIPKRRSNMIEYTTWNDIKSRCLNPKNIRYSVYGGRGITVCERWLNDFEAFLSDMGARPSNNHSIDRIDNDRGYEPANCRWATREEQCRNLRANVWVDYGGRKMILADWAKELNVKGTRITEYFRKGKSFDWIYNHFKNKNGRKRNKNVKGIGKRA